MLNRRRLLGTTAASMAATMLPAGFAFAQQTRLVAMGHAVHRDGVSGPGGDVLADWTAANDVEVEWLTYGVSDIHDRLFREASLNESSIHTAFLLNRFTNEQIANMFEPLDPFLESAPIENLDGIPEGMRNVFIRDGATYGIPFSHATKGFVYNEELLEERGLDGPPGSFEDFLEYAEKLTYTRDDGTQVNGFAFTDMAPAGNVDFLRAYGGDFINDAFELRINEPETVEAVTKIVELYEKGVMPRNQTAYTSEDAITGIQQGRLAMTLISFPRYVLLNDPERSNFPGRIKIVDLPKMESRGAGASEAPPITEIWALVIPRNAPNKELAWSFIREVSSLEANVIKAINGLGPVRPAAYEDPRVQDKLPYASSEAQAIERARVPLPGFSNSARVGDIYQEEMQAALIGAKSPRQAMDDIARRVEPLLPN